MVAIAAISSRSAWAANPPAAPAEITELSLISLVKELPTRRAAQGDAEDRAGLARTEALIVERLTAFGYEPRLEEVRWTLPRQRKAGAAGGEADDPPPTVWHNIIVDLPGSDRAREVLLIGAHFDAVPGSPGADDNGTGTAALLELARVLKDEPRRRTVRLVFFTLEEVGCVGSRQHAKTWLAARASASEDVRETMIGMLSLEMLGYYCDEEGCQKSPVGKIEGVFEPPTVGDSIALVSVAPFQSWTRPLAAAMKASEPALKVTLFDFAPAPIPDILRSDHGPFLLAGVPAAMLSDTANFRNPNYHKATDTVETLDVVRFARTVRAVRVAVVEMANPRDGK